MGNSWALGGAKEAGAITLNRKVVGKFLKVCVDGEGAHQGAHQGARPQRPASPFLPLEVEYSLPPFFSSMAENMICAESGDPPTSTAIASPTGYLTAS